MHGDGLFFVISVAGSTSLSLLIVRFIVSHILMPRLPLNVGGGDPGLGGEGETTDPRNDSKISFMIEFKGSIQPWGMAESLMSRTA
jgi:hypothetical protein